jgi:protein-S-isoprenylcysteine O-methyltransferase Ste14
MVLIGILHLALLQWEARREEKHLSALHGPAYANYIASVGRFFPKSFGPRASTS